MTPKEKAQYIVDSMMRTKNPDHTSCICFEIAKRCALIAVDEMIEIYSKLFKDFDKVSLFVTAFKTDKDFNETMNDLKNNQLKPYAIKSVFYWEEVRKEIESL